MKKLSKKTLRKMLIFLTISLFFINSILIPISGKQATMYGKDDDCLTFDQDMGSYDLLIIAPSKFSDYLQPLVTHKNTYGVKTKLVTIEEVYTQIFWKGKDDAEKLKYFIKESVEEWNISYVLLVGGRKDQSKTESWWVPVRYTHIHREYEGLESFSEKKFLTDLYFADIYDSKGNFSSWDDDGDGIFGEWLMNSSAEDTPDLYPDISVGRLPCRNIIDVKIIVNKIINYETGSFDGSWFKKMLVVAGDTYPKKTPDFIDGEVHTQQAIDLTPDFEHVKLWASDGSLNNWFDIVKEMNKGCGFVFFSGHGGPQYWLTHPVNNLDKYLSIFRLVHMNFLFNKNKLPICLSASGCFNNMFNVSLTNSKYVYFHILFLLNQFAIPYNIPKCWGWALTSNPFGGSIATIAATAYSYESSDITGDIGGCEWLDIHFFEEYNKSTNKILGECWGNTINCFLQNFTIDWSDSSSKGDALIAKNVEQWFLIGDPSLKIGGYNLESN